MDLLLLLGLGVDVSQHVDVGEVDPELAQQSGHPAEEAKQELTGSRPRAAEIRAASRPGGALNNRFEQGGVGGAGGRRDRLYWERRATPSMPFISFSFKEAQNTYSSA